MAEIIAKDILIYTGVEWKSVKDGTVSIYDGTSFKNFLNDDIKIYADGDWYGIARTVLNFDLSDIEFSSIEHTIIRNCLDMTPPGTLSVVSNPSSIMVEIDNDDGNIYFMSILSPPKPPVGTTGTVVFAHSFGFTFEINYKYV